MVSYTDFAKLDLRVAEIVNAELVKTSEKLVKLTTDLGGEHRTLIAGIVKQYPPESLVGRQVVVVANLEPKKLMGIDSLGMILCADTTEGPVLIQPEKKINNGTRIR